MSPIRTLQPKKPVTNVPLSEPPYPRRSGTFSERPIPTQAGIGLRTLHHQQIIERRSAGAWLEVHPESYLDRGALSDDLEKIRQEYALSFHCEGLSLGSSAGLNPSYLSALSGLIDRFRPTLISAHLSGNQFGGLHGPNLARLSNIKRALDVVAADITRCQDILGNQLLLENPPMCLNASESSASEPQFLAELVRRTGCGVLLDINNIYVNARNRGQAPAKTLAHYLACIPAGSILEIHLSGHSVYTAQSGARVYVSDHGSPVAPQVWRLFEQTVAALGQRPTLIEWDINIPPLGLLEIEAATAQFVLDREHFKNLHQDPSVPTEANASRRNPVW